MNTRFLVISDPLCTAFQSKVWNIKSSQKEQAIYSKGEFFRWSSQHKCEAGGTVPQVELLHYITLLNQKYLKMHFSKELLLVLSTCNLSSQLLQHLCALHYLHFKIHRHLGRQLVNRIKKPYSFKKTSCIAKISKLNRRMSSDSKAQNKDTN